MRTPDTRHVQIDRDATERRIERRPYFDPTEGSYEVEHITLPITIAGVTQLVAFTRLTTLSPGGYAHNLISDERCVTVRVGRGIKTYAVSIVLLDISDRAGIGPGTYSMANFNALNRVAYPVGWVVDRDETNVRTGYGA